MPSDEHNSLTARATGLNSSLFIVASPHDVPYHQPQKLQCLYHGLLVIFHFCSFSIIKVMTRYTHVVGLVLIAEEVFTLFFGFHTILCLDYYDVLGESLKWIVLLYSYFTLIYIWEHKIFHSDLNSWQRCFTHFSSFIYVYKAVYSGLKIGEVEN